MARPSDNINRDSYFPFLYQHLIEVHETTCANLYLCCRRQFRAGAAEKWIMPIRTWKPAPTGL